mmetsp:Transcript_71447/g.113641  ORF Transcript_71447/g.113641 Transcript_71447/m.113641 type:complete len:210 (+) Transcript_71447:59-688(+)
MKIMQQLHTNTDKHTLSLSPLSQSKSSMFLKIFGNVCFRGQMSVVCRRRRFHHSSSFVLNLIVVFVVVVDVLMIVCAVGQKRFHSTSSVTSLRDLPVIPLSSVVGKRIIIGCRILSGFHFTIRSKQSIRDLFLPESTANTLVAVSVGERKDRLHIVLLANNNILLTLHSIHACHRFVVMIDIHAQIIVFLFLFLLLIVITILPSIAAWF